MVLGGGGQGFCGGGWGRFGSASRKLWHGLPRVSRLVCDFGQSDLIKSHFSQGQRGPKISMLWGYCSMK